MRLTGDPGASGTVDEQRLRAAAAGDEEAWRQLVACYEQEVWQLASEASARPDEAAAVCEVVWRRLAQELGELDGQSLRVWLHRTTRLESERAQLRAGHQPGAPQDPERRHGPRTGSA